MIKYSAQFKRRYRKLPQKLQSKVDERLKLFVADEFNEILDNHKLNGEYEGCRSINITGDLRVIYYLLSEGFYKIVTVGTHSELYG